MSLQNNSLRNDTLLKEIAQGKWDSTLAAFARQAKQANVPVYLRFGYEMNGYWFPWGEKPAEFVSAWIHAHRIFVEEQASNVQWIFAPGVLWGGMKAETDIMPYYPGDPVVDIVGLDGYNFGDDAAGHQWQSFTDIFGASLVSVQKQGKPLWITEIGCATDIRRQDWLGELFAFMDNNRCVETMLWFNMHKSGEPDFRLEADSASLAAMRNWLAK
jgi:beta-mannanase